MSIKGRAYIMGAFEHPTRLAPDKSTAQLHALAEGPTVLTNIVDSDLDAIRIGAAVNLVWKPSEGGPPVPFYALA